MNYWLVKSEPSTWAWEQQKKFGVEKWDGVRNHQANNYMKQMCLGDKAFFYHSGKQPHIIGIVTVCQTFYPDLECLPFGFVDMKYHSDLPHPIYLSQIKAAAHLQDLILLKQSRLSVMPISDTQWHRILRLPSK